MPLKGQASSIDICTQDGGDVSAFVPDRRLRDLLRSDGDRLVRFAAEFGLRAQIPSEDEGGPFVFRRSACSVVWGLTPVRRAELVIGHEVALALGVTDSRIVY